MDKPPKHEAEPARLAALRELEILDTPPEDAFDQCAALAAELCGVSNAAVSLVDDERQWFKAIFGRLPKETTRDVSFCGHAVAHDDEVLVPDATKDPRFADNPLVIGGQLKFYAGVPLRGRDDLPLGTLCVIHDQPKELSGAELEALRVIAKHLEDYLLLRLIALRVGAEAKIEGARAEQLVEADRRRREATAMLVHDLRNPLTVVSVLAQQMRLAGDLSPEAEQSLDDLLGATQAAQHLLINALDVARSETGHVPVRFETFDVGVVSQRMIDRVAPLAQRRDHRVELVDELTDRQIYGDSLLISRALRNFLDNALKFAPRASTVVVRLCEHGDSVDLRVEDTGKPVPAELRERIFEPFFSGSTDRASYGLGLALCAIVAREHAGRAWVEDRPGGGNVFVLRVKRRAPDKPA